MSTILIYVSEQLFSPGTCLDFKSRVDVDSVPRGVPVGMEKRVDPRFPFTMKVHLLEGEGDGFYETADISAGGTYLNGDPGVPEGTLVWLRLELVSFRDGKEWVYPLDAEVDVVRISQDANAVPSGFACRWISVVSHGDIRPIQEFLRRVLSVSTGFVQAFRPTDQGSSQSFSFVFPNPAMAQEAPSIDPADAEDSPEDEDSPAIPTIDEDPAAFLDGQSQSSHSTRTGIYVVLPMSYQTDDGTFDGKAVKLHSHGMRVSTQAELPAAYQRVDVTIQVRHRDRREVLLLNSTVTTVRPAIGGGDGQFEVEFSLGNEPEALSMYRKILDKLVKSLSDT